MTRKVKIYDAVDLRHRISDAFDQRDIVADHTASEHYYRRISTAERAASVTTKQSLIKGFKQWAVDRGVDHMVLHRDRFCQGDDSVVYEARRAHVVELGRAADIGTGAHGGYDAYFQDWISITKRPDKLSGAYLHDGADPAEICATRSFDRFLDEIEIVPIFSEIRIFYSRGRDSWGGSVDAGFIARTPYKDRGGSGSCGTGSRGFHDYERQTNGHLWCIRCSREVTEQLILGDWKTSNSIDKAEYAEQATVYCKTIETGAAIKFDETWIIRFSKEKAHYEILKVSDKKRAWERFLAVSRCYDSRIEYGTMLEPLIKREVHSLF